MAIFLNGLNQDIANVDEQHHYMELECTIQERSNSDFNVKCATIQFYINNHNSQSGFCRTLCKCVGEIISLPWFSKELKNNLSKNNCLRGVILILLVRESIFVRWGFLFPIVLVPRYKLSLCHTPIKLDLLGFPRIGVFTCWLRDHVITRFALQALGCS